MEDKNNIVVIEWPERLGTMLPQNVKKIQFRYISENEREIIYEA
jgi:tRNA A37 threonylcarbamoyladenosine biosynthesis protein TsaE